MPLGVKGVPSYTYTIVNAGPASLYPYIRGWQTRGGVSRLPPPPTPPLTSNPPKSLRSFYFLSLLPSQSLPRQSSLSFSIRLIDINQVFPSLGVVLSRGRVEMLMLFSVF